jgi:hypothetical protein
VASTSLWRRSWDATDDKFKLQNAEVKECRCCHDAGHFGSLQYRSGARLASFLRELRTAIEVPDIAVHLAALEGKNALDFR